MIERRQSTRVQCELPALLRNLNAGHVQPIVNTVVTNISRTGLCMQLDQFIPVPSRLQVYLNLPNQPTIEVQAAPAWIAEIPHRGKYTMGVRFIEIHPQDEETIQNFQYQTLLKKLPAKKSI